MKSEEILLEKKKRPVNWKLEFGWYFWVPFFFAVVTIMYAEEGHRIWASISACAAVLFAESSGKHIARKQAERDAETEGISSTLPSKA